MVTTGAGAVAKRAFVTVLLALAAAYGEGRRHRRAGQRSERDMGKSPLQGD